MKREYCPAMRNTVYFRLLSVYYIGDLMHRAANLRIRVGLDATREIRRGDGRGELTDDIFVTCFHSLAC